MFDAQKATRDIDTLREAIRLDFLDLDRLNLSHSDREGIILHIKLCQQELEAILVKLDDTQMQD